ncbi:MAG: 6-bladed beta-propeller [Alistipes sp.]|jgi:hypothetical protein|nr:6-bladed beta-propeller [Alistipes sp.]
MKSIKIGIMLLVSAVFMQCVPKEVSDNIPSLFPLEQSIEVSNLNPYIDNVEFIPLEENEESFLSYIGKLLIDASGNFIVRDMSGTVKVFDSRGKFLFNVGHKGRGPGEYLSARDISLDDTGNSLLVLSLGYVLVYNVSDGKFIRQIETPREDYEAICTSSDGGFFLFSCNPGDFADFSNDFYAVKQFEADGTKKGEFLPRKDFVISQGIFTQSHDKSYLLRPQEGDNILYKISDNRIIPQYKIDFGNRAIPARFMFDKGGNPLANIQAFIRSGYYKLPIYFQDTKNQLYFACAGPNGNYHHFLYSLPNVKAIHWEDTIEDSAPTLLMASDDENLYAMVVGLDKYLEIEENNLNPLTRAIIQKFKEDKIAWRTDNPVLVKLRFRV